MSLKTTCHDVLPWRDAVAQEMRRELAKILRKWPEPTDSQVVARSVRDACRIMAKTKEQPPPSPSAAAPAAPPASSPAAAPSPQTPKGSLKSQAARGDLEVLVEVPKDDES